MNKESAFRKIFLSKSKPVLIGISYRPPGKCNFVNCLEFTISNTSVRSVKKYCAEKLKSKRDCFSKLTDATILGKNFVEVFIF